MAMNAERCTEKCFRFIQRDYFDEYRGQGGQEGSYRSRPRLKYDEEGANDDISTCEIAMKTGIGSVVQEYIP